MAFNESHSDNKYLDKKINEVITALLNDMTVLVDNGTDEDVSLPELFDRLYTRVIQVEHAIAGDITVIKDTDSNWNKKNPVLVSGQTAYSSDLGLYKTGDGVSKWRDLSYNNAISLKGLETEIEELNYVKGVKSNIQKQIDSNRIYVSNTKPTFACIWFNTSK